MDSNGSMHRMEYYRCRSELPAPYWLAVCDVAHYLKRGRHTLSGDPAMGKCWEVLRDIYIPLIKGYRIMVKENQVCHLTPFQSVVTIGDVEMNVRACFDYYFNEIYCCD